MKTGEATSFNKRSLSRLFIVLALGYMLVGLALSLAEILLPAHPFEVTEGVIQLGGGGLGGLLLYALALHLRGRPWAVLLSTPRVSRVLWGSLTVLAAIFFLLISLLVFKVLPLNHGTGSVDSSMIAKGLDIAKGVWPYQDPESGRFSMLYNVGVPLLIGALFRLVGFHIWAAHLMAVLLWLILLSLVTVVARNASTERWETFVTILLFSSVMLIVLIDPWKLHPDTLPLIFAVLGGYIFTRPLGLLGGLLAGTCLGLSFIAKQNYPFPMLGAAALMGLKREWRGRAVACVVSFLAVCGAEYILMQRATDGWFGFWVFELPSRHPLVFDPYAQAWNIRMFLFSPLIIGLSLLGGWKAVAEKREELTFWVYAAVMGFGVGSVSSMKVGSGVNSMSPFMACLIILTAYGMNALKKIDTPHSPSFGPSGIKCIIAIGIALQILLCILPLQRRYTQIMEHYQVLPEVVQVLANVPQPAFFPYFPEVSLPRDEWFRGDMVELLDYFNADFPVPTMLKRRIETGFYNSLVIGEGDWNWFTDDRYRTQVMGQLISEHYCLASDKKDKWYVLLPKKSATTYEGNGISHCRETKIINVE